ncbi:MAG: Tfp pilus assembly protein FimT/FimU [Phycisphaerae bacterium]
MKSTHHPVAKLRTAFTLVEVLTVIVILGIASIIVIPQMGTRDDLNVAAASRVLIADMAWAQNRSIVSQSWHFLRFSGQTYTVEVYDPSADSFAVAEHPIDRGAFARTFGAGGSPGLEPTTIVSADFDDATLVGFDEMGSPVIYVAATGSAAALQDVGVLTIRSGEFTLTIDVQPFTGEVSVNP